MKTQEYPDRRVDFELYIEKISHQADTPMRSRAVTELTIITGGKATHVIEGIGKRTEKGHATCVLPGFKSCYREVEELEGYHLYFDMDRIILWNKDLRLLSGFQAFFISTAYYRYLHIYNSDLYLSREDLSFAQKLCEMMYQSFQVKREGYRITVKEYFLCLLTFLSNKYTPAAKTESKKFQYIENAKRFIDMHYGDKLSVRKLSDMAHLSERHFTRMFKQIYEHSPSSYIKRCRLNHACDLIQNTSLSFTEISEQCGFSNPPAFTKSFKENFSLTPSEYRESFSRV